MRRNPSVRAQGKTVCECTADVYPEFGGLSGMGSIAHWAALSRDRRHFARALTLLSLHVTHEKHVQVIHDELQACKHLWMKVLPTRELRRKYNWHQLDHLPYFIREGPPFYYTDTSA